MGWADGASGGVFGLNRLNRIAEKPKLPEDFEEKTWEKLRTAVQAVHAKKPVSSSLEELYRVRATLRLPSPPSPPWRRWLLLAAGPDSRARRRTAEVHDAEKCRAARVVDRKSTASTRAARRLVRFVRGWVLGFDDSWRPLCPRGIE